MKIKLYQSKDWLWFHYWMANLSIAKIAKLYNYSPQTILNWMIKFNIPYYKVSEATSNHVNLSQEAYEFIDGELLGDGCLASPYLHSAYFVYDMKHKEYVKYLSTIFDSFGIRQCGHITPHLHNYRNKTYYYSYRYHSFYYIELLPIRKRWYPNGKKIVPRDLKLTPLVCRQWYIGDGTLSNPSKGRSFIFLATYGFEIDDVEFLVKKLKELNFFAKRQKNNTIYISPYSTNEFLNFIGKCPVECYEYKWKIKQGRFRWRAPNIW